MTNLEFYQTKEAIGKALAAQLDALFGRNQPKQLTERKEADHE